MKKILLSSIIVLVLLSGINKFALADEVTVNLTLKNNGDVVYSGSVILPPTGNISISDSSGNPYDTNADSVLSIVNTADTSSGEFNISNLIYYDMFGAFYLKCINVSGSELCDNWQYKVDGESPSVGMDSKILSGGENIVLYFGDENKAPEPEPEPEPEPQPVRSSGGGYYRMPIQTVLPEPQIIPPTLPIQQEVTPIIEDISSKEKIKTPNTVTITKIPKKTVKIEKKTLTATVINSVPATPTQIETPKKNWFMRLLNSIFSIF